jgi:hypothetical protein
MAAIAVRSVTSAVASLRRLSPSRSVTTRRGMPTRRATALAATASGGATTAPTARASAKSTRGRSSMTTPATATAVARTRPTESSVIARLLLLRSTQGVRIAVA